MTSALEVLEDPEVRLVTLLGVGGAGKTRLAIEIADRRCALPRRAWSCCSRRDRPASDVAGIARAWGSAPSPGSRSSDLAGALAGRELLLMLDNLEHLLDAAMIVSEVLAAAPELT